MARIQCPNCGEAMTLEGNVCGHCGAEKREFVHAFQAEQKRLIKRNLIGCAAGAATIGVMFFLAYLLTQILDA